MISISSQLSHLTHIHDLESCKTKFCFFLKQSPMASQAAKYLMFEDVPQYNRAIRLSTTVHLSEIATANPNAPILHSGKIPLDSQKVYFKVCLQGNNNHSDFYDRTWHYAVLEIHLPGANKDMVDLFIRYLQYCLRSRNTGRGTSSWSQQ